MSISVLARKMPKSADAVITVQIDLDLVRKWGLHIDPFRMPEGIWVSVNGVSDWCGWTAGFNVV